MHAASEKVVYFMQRPCFIPRLPASCASRVNLPFAGFQSHIHSQLERPFLSTMGENAAVSPYCKPFFPAVLLCCHSTDMSPGGLVDL